MPRGTKSKTVAGGPNYQRLEAEGRNPGFNPVPSPTKTIQGQKVTMGYVREPGSVWRTGYSLEQHLANIEAGKTPGVDMTNLYPDEDKEFQAHMKKAAKAEKAEVKETPKKSK